MLINGMEILSELAAIRLRVILRQVEAKKQTLNKLDREILSLCELTEMESEISKFKTILIKYLFCNCPALFLLKQPWRRPKRSLLVQYTRLKHVYPS